MYITWILGVVVMVSCICYVIVVVLIMCVNTCRKTYITNFRWFGTWYISANGLYFYSFFFFLFFFVSEIAMVCGLRVRLIEFISLFLYVCVRVCVRMRNAWCLLTNFICANACKCISCVRDDVYIHMSYILHMPYISYVAIYIYIYGIYTYTANADVRIYATSTAGLSVHVFTLFFFFYSLIYLLPYLASPCLAILILYSHVSLALFDLYEWTRILATKYAVGASRCAIRRCVNKVAGRGKNSLHKMFPIYQWFPNFFISLPYTLLAITILDEFKSYRDYSEELRIRESINLQIYIYTIRDQDVSRLKSF